MNPEPRAGGGSNGSAARIFAVNCTVHYGGKVGIRGVTTEILDRTVNRFHRSIGLREVHLPSLSEPHERSH